jgi:ABC-2 type transport system ATP-binding protein
VIGRDPGSQLPLSDDQVSRHHCQVSFENGVAVLADLGSTNGTFVDGRLATGQVSLNPGARIQAGDSVIEYPLALDATQARPAVSSFEQMTRAQPVPAPQRAPEPERKWNGIEVYGLIREFKGGFRAVDELYLQVNPGEIYGFLGPNGAGKSTSVHMLTTLLPPSGGAAHVAGYDVARNPGEVRAAIGVALQEASLDPLLTAYEHMELQCSMQGLPRSEWKRRGDEMIERVTLTEAAGRRVGGYSGGMKRRLDLALALVHHPRIIFLDEPTTGLDPKTRGDLWDEVARLAKEDGVTVFLTTQYLEEADVLADRVGIIDHGRLVAEGTPDELKAEIGRPTLEVTPQSDADTRALASVLGRFGERSDAVQGLAVRLRRGAEVLPEVFREIDSAGLSVANVQLHAPSLDDVFLAKTGRSLDAEGAQASAGMAAAPAGAQGSPRG